MNIFGKNCWCHSARTHSFRPRSLEPYPLSRIPLGRIPISRCPLSRILLSRTSLISPTIACCRRPLFLNDVSRIHQTFRCVIYIDHLYIYVYLLYRLGYSSNVRALSKRLRVRVRHNTHFNIETTYLLFPPVLR